MQRQDVFFILILYTLSLFIHVNGGTLKLGNRKLQLNFMFG